MAPCKKSKPSMSDFPAELLDKICKHLDTETDVSCFRAVCKHWRSSTSRFIKFQPLKLPYLFSHGPQTHVGHLLLTQRTVYLFRSKDDNSKHPKSWIIKVEHLDDGKVRLLNPVNDHDHINHSRRHPIPKVLNTLDYRVTEICKYYNFRYVNPNSNENDGNDRLDSIYNCLRKVAVSVDDDKYVVMAISIRGSLWCIRSGDEKWSMPSDDDENMYRDVVTYNGRFYAVDSQGMAWMFESSSFKPILIAYGAPDSLYAKRDYLFELHKGKLFLVEETTNKKVSVWTCYNSDDGCQCRAGHPVNMCRIDTREGECAELKKVVKDRIIFVGGDCSFSVSSEEFGGCKGTTRVICTVQYISFQEEKEEDEEKGPEYIEYYDQSEYDMHASSDDEPDLVDSFIPGEDGKLEFRELHSHKFETPEFETLRVVTLSLEKCQRWESPYLL